MSRYICPRPACGEVCFTTDPPHLCKDVKKRHERREKMVTAVCDILYANTMFAPSGDNEPVAQEIVGTLLQMGARDF